MDVNTDPRRNIEVGIGLLVIILRAASLAGIMPTVNKQPLLLSYGGING
jgi:hypothetical protein